MRINDVEKLTGLTAKSIRFYESKGLITINHDTENGYRNYTEKDVLHLKRIRLLRYLDFSIEEINNLQEQDLPEIQKILQNKADCFENQKDDCDLKKSLCISLSKDYDMENKMIEEYDGVVDFLEGSEFEELRESVKEFTCPSFPEMIVWTLMLGAPILSLFINIQMYSGNKEILTTNSIFALLGTVLLCLQWRDYFSKRKYQKERIKEKGKRTIWVVLAIIPVIAIMIGVIILINEFVIILFAPKDWLFFEFQGAGEFWLVVIIELPLFGALVYLIEKIRNVPENKSHDLAILFGFLWKHKLVSAIAWCSMFYLIITNVAFATPEKIVSYSPFHPMGVTYEYGDIDKVDTSFGWKNFAFKPYKRKGTFSYRIHIDDKVLVFSQPSINESIERYEEDTYLELEEFDAKVMSYGVPKEGSSKYSDRCSMDQVYIDRFIRIVQNGN